MGITFQFATASRILFGNRLSREIPDEVESFGKKIFLLCGSDPGRIAWLSEMLTGARFEINVFSVSGEPEISKVLMAVNRARRFKAEFVIAIGGGSVMDTGKVVAAMLTNHEPLDNYLEVIGAGKSLTHRPVPLVAVPTTAGTGTEVTKNAVICSAEHQVKVSMRHEWMIPDLAVIDPELTLSLPPELTASTGMDALTQLIEPFVSTMHNPLTDAICREGLSRAAASLETAFTQADNIQARENMAIASLCGGIALANAKLGAVHGFAGPIGGMFKISHGTLCARLLPAVMEINVQHLSSLQDSERINRFHQLGRILTGRSGSTAYEAVRWIKNLCTILKIPPLSDYGLTRDTFPEIIERAKQASSMKGNPVSLRAEELTKILESAVYN
jgi:alcohol dehydrogenase class IV